MIQIFVQSTGQNDEESPEENQLFCATTKKLKSRQDVVNEGSLPISKPLPDVPTIISIGLWFIIAILFVQFNLYVVPVQGRQPPLPMTEAMETYQDDPEEIQMTHDCSEFCQDPPESSGRWECPDIRWSVHVNPRCLHTTADPHHVLP